MSLLRARSIPRVCRMYALNQAPIAEIPDWLVADLMRLRGTGGKSGARATKGRHPAIMRWCGQNWRGPGHEDELIAGAIKFDEENHADPRGAAHAAECAQWFIDRDKEPCIPGAKVTIGRIFGKKGARWRKRFE